MRNLASIQKIAELTPIPGADAIERATVLGWQLVVKKGEFAVGDLCVYCEIDSVLPKREEFDFLKERKYRIKTIRLRGQISQGICFPLSVLPDGINVAEGVDVTAALGIKKYEPYEEEIRCAKQVKKLTYPKWMPQWVQRLLHKSRFIREYYMKKSAHASFPSLIPKTDETRVQVLQPMLDKYAGTRCYVTEKIDGSSITVYIINGKFGVCSRNLDLARDKNDKYWSAVVACDLERKMRAAFGKKNVALQGELIGPGIQGNKYRRTSYEIYFFNIYFINQHAYGGFYELTSACHALGVKTVPILDENYTLSNSMTDLVKLSYGKSELADVYREGVVVRPTMEITDHELHAKLVRDRISFKSVNPEFLLKYGE